MPSLSQSYSTSVPTISVSSPQSNLKMGDHIMNNGMMHNGYNNNNNNNNASSSTPSTTHDSNSNGNRRSSKRIDHPIVKQLVDMGFPENYVQRACKIFRV